MSKKKTNYLKLLPKEIIIKEILPKLPIKDISSISQVSRKYRKLGIEERKRRIMEELVPWVRNWITEDESKVHDKAEKLYTSLKNFTLDSSMDEVKDAILEVSEFKYPLWFDDSASGIIDAIESAIDYQIKDREYELADIILHRRRATGTMGKFNK